MFLQEEIILCEYDETFLNLSFEWLQDDEIRYLQDSKRFTKEDQVRWYNSLSLRHDYFVWGVKLNDIPIGVCGVKNIKDNIGEYFGYIGVKSLWGQGYGTQMMLALERLLPSLGIKSLFLHVLANNIRAISLYKKMGYTTTQEDEQYITMIKNNI